MSKPRRGSILNVVLPASCQRCGAEHQEWYVVFRDHAGDHVHLLCVRLLNPCGVSPSIAVVHTVGVLACIECEPPKIVPVYLAITKIQFVLFCSLFMVEIDKYKMSLIFLIYFKHETDAHLVHQWYKFMSAREREFSFILLPSLALVYLYIQECLSSFDFLTTWSDLLPTGT